LGVLTDLKEKLKEELDDASNLLIASKYAVGLTGAGISVESEIPPFRGPGGIWTKYGEPAMDGYQRFLADPKGWWENIIKKITEKSIDELTSKIWDAKPNQGHYSLAGLEKMGILKHLITQNIDDLHRKAGSKNLAEIHGNINKLRCISCNRRWDRDAFEIKEIPPRCPECNGIIKTDTVFFGEPIPRDVLAKCETETAKCDCMLVVGTTATVYPSASFPIRAKRRGAALIEVNLYESELSYLCDVVLRGPSGKILPLLVEDVKEKLQKKSSSA
jgi:NAD-dependent deacetylase